MAAVYAKPFLSIPQQIALLKARGLDVGSDADAEAVLSQFGYYRLSGYWHPLRVSTYDVEAGQVVYSNNFQNGATLGEAMLLAEFDQRLRSLFTEAVERIEIAIRVRLALLLGTRGAHAHRDPAQFYPRFTQPNPKTGENQYVLWLERVDAHERRSKEQFAVHFREKYGNGPFPLWVSIEVWDFGMLSKLIGGMTVADQKALSVPLGLGRTGLFASWLRAINHVRNICAHHSRLWNRSPSDQPVPPRAGEHALLEHLVADTFAHTRLYAVAAALQFLLRQIDPAFSAVWAGRLKTHFGTFPTIANVPIGQSGFPLNWAAEPLWN